MPRSLELLITSILVVLLFPLFLLIGLAIWLESRGPIFYCQKRIGFGGKPFTLFKFRKMHNNLNHQGPMITGRYDPRFTKVGQFLERTKMDELPQLFNVLRGEMSLIGPRPDVEKFIKYYPEKWEEVFKVKPGILGLYQILHRNETELLPDDFNDIENYYIRFVLSDKLDINIKYVRRRNIWLDLWILFAGAWITIFGTLTSKSFRSIRGFLAILSLDTLTAAFSYTMAYIIRFDGAIPKATLNNFFYLILLVCAIRAGVFVFYRIPRRLPNYLSLQDIKVIMKSVFIGSLFILCLSFMLKIQLYSRSIIVIDMAFLIILLSLSRLTYMWIKQWKSVQAKIPHVLIAGADEESVYAIELLRSHTKSKYKIIGVIDGDSSRRKHQINGVEIIGHIGDIELLLTKYKIDLVVVIESALSLTKQMRVDDFCVKYKIPIVYHSSIIKNVERSLNQPAYFENNLLLNCAK